MNISKNGNSPQKPSMPTVTGKRSKDGCFSCKKLRIKCSETKPACKHCCTTGRKCEYPQKFQTNGVSLNLIMTKISSAKQMLGISDFQYELLKHHLDFGCQIIAKGDTQLHNVWSKEVPKLFIENSLVRKSLYSVSAMTMWAQYELESIHSVTFRDNGVTKYLFLETERLFNNLLAVLNRMELNGNFENDISYVIGSLAVATYLCYHPSPPVPLVDFSTSHYVDLLSISKMLVDLINQTVPILEKTSIRMFPLYWNSLSANFVFQQDIPITKHLRSFILESTSHNSNEAIDECMNVIERMDSALNLMISQQNVIIFFSLFPFMTAGLDQFCNLLRERDYNAMKVAYFYSVLNQILEFNINSEGTLWKDYMDTFMEMWPDTDPFDSWLYYYAVELNMRVPHDSLGLLYILGADECRAHQQNTLDPKSQYSGGVWSNDLMF